MYGKHAIVMATAAVLVIVGVAAADWNEGDDHKMHFPQLPDVDGWDVAWHDYQLADDWTCSQSGVVDDIHLWYSWKQGNEGQIQSVGVEIYNNEPAVAGDPASFSHPKDFLWGWNFQPGEFITRPYGAGNQGWFDPSTNEWNRPDHTTFDQLNITDIEAILRSQGQEPFYQVEGEIYWLVVNVNIEAGGADLEIGWKTADVERYPDQYNGTHYMDDAVWWDSSGANPGWHPLKDPENQEISLDLAFVITPEPASMALFGLGGLLMLKRRRRVRAETPWGLKRRRSS